MLIHRTNFPYTKIISLYTRVFESLLLMVNIFITQFRMPLNDIEFIVRQQSVDSRKWNCMHRSSVAKYLTSSNKEHFLLKRMQNALFDENKEKIDVLWQFPPEGALRQLPPA